MEGSARTMSFRTGVPRLMVLMLPKVDVVCRACRKLGLESKVWRETFPEEAVVEEGDASPGRCGEL